MDQALNGREAAAPGAEIGILRKRGLGRPWCGMGAFQFPLHLVALGKLGSRQMHYSSDLDLLFLYDDPVDDSFVEAMKACPPSVTPELCENAKARSYWLHATFRGASKTTIS